MGTLGTPERRIVQNWMDGRSRRRRRRWRCEYLGKADSREVAVGARTLLGWIVGGVNRNRLQINWKKKTEKKTWTVNCLMIKKETWIPYIAFCSGVLCRRGGEVITDSWAASSAGSMRCSNRPSCRSYNTRRLRKFSRHFYALIWRGRLTGFMPLHSS